MYLLRNGLQFIVRGTSGIVEIEVLFRNKDSNDTNSITLIPLVCKRWSSCPADNVWFAIL